MTDLQKFAKKNRNLFWDIFDFKELSEMAIEERILKYWNWKQVKELESILWKEKFRDIYTKIINKKRVDLWKKTLNLFNLYFNINKNV